MTTSATLLQAVRAVRPVRTLMQICNESSQTVYVGSLPALTVNNGFPLYAGWQLELDGRYMGPLYGVVSAATADVRVWERTAV